MARHLLDNETLFGTPAASKSYIFSDAASKKLAQVDDSGAVHGLLSASFPASGTGSLSLPAATDTFATNSGILIPSFGFQAGQMFIWYLFVTKTAAGTGVLVATIRYGSALSTGDTSVIAMTGVAQTATAFGSLLTVGAQVRTVGASGVIVGSLGGGGVALGVGTTATGVSGTIDLTTTANKYLSLSLNPGTGDAWTLEAVRGQLIH